MNNVRPQIIIILLLKLFIARPITSWNGYIGITECNPIGSISYQFSKVHGNLYRPIRLFLENARDPRVIITKMAKTAIFVLQRTVTKP